jgi:DNA-directed RNA polymerase subunit RPC12/RpoP
MAQELEGGAASLPEASRGGREFPCRQCGAKVEFAPGTSTLECPYCGARTEIEPEGTVEETDFASMLARLESEAETEDVAAVQCAACGARVEPVASREAFHCPFCGSSIVATATSHRLIKPKALLPFAVARTRADDLFRRWIRSLWLAPDAVKRMARLEGRLQGLYAPFWTYDAGTSTSYTGERGDDRTETRTRTVVRDGRHVTETYHVTVTDWHGVSGRVARDFDDVLVLGSRTLPRALAEALEPWDLGALVPYADEYLSGFQAERYQIGLAEGWSDAREHMERVIREDIRHDIGGDHQRIHSLSTRHADVTFKHVLLPLWICSYRFRDRVFRFLVNARTGEVQGERPWSWVKILFLAAGIAAAIVAVVLLNR